MSEERRFSEEEVAEILKNAAELEHTDRTLSSASTGLTLSELNDIGREAGISPEAMRRAVSRLSAPEPQSRQMLGLPIGVGRTVELERTLNEDEWERLVVLLREKFNARGVVRKDGNLKSWSNGNLQILLEPTTRGHRLRMSTFNQGLQGWLIGGIAVVVMGLAMIVTGIVSGTLTDQGLGASGAAVAAAGVGLFGIGALRLPGWARTRQRQMDEIAETVESQSLVMIKSGAPSNS